MWQPVRSRRCVILGAATFGLALAAGPAASLETARAFTQHILESWGPKEGLRQHAVNDIVQTRDGYLWLATQDGLVRFDGARFVTFDSRNTPGFAHEFLYSLAEAPDGTLWVGTYHGLMRVKDGSFRTYLKEDGLADAFVRAVALDSAGTLWVSGYTGLSRVRGDRIEKDPRFEDKSIRALAAARSGGVWMSAPGEIHRLNGDETKMYGPREGLPATTQVLRLYEGPDGVLWFASPDGLGRLSDGRIRFFTVKDGLASNAVFDVRTDRNGTLWVGTSAGLHRMDGDRLVPQRRNGLTAEAIESLFEDGEGSLWIGTRTGGLRRLRDGPFTMYGHGEGLPADSVWSVRQMRDGRVWIGTAAGPGVLEPGAGPASLTSRSDVAPDGALALAEGRDGTVWVGMNSAVARIEGGRTRRYGRADGLPAASVRAIHEDAAGRLWLGTTGSGVYVREGERFVAQTPPDGVPKGAGYVSTILEGRDGSLWFGTDFGLWRFQDGRFQVYTKSEGLPGDYVCTIFEDRDGVLWAGTNPGGLGRLEDGRWSAFRADSGLLDERVHAIVEDQRGRLWFSSDRGLFAVAKKDLDDYAAGRVKAVTSIVFDTHDGLRVTEGNGGGSPAAWRAADGRLWFATVGGAAVVDPEDQSRRSVVPTAFLEELLVDGRLVTRNDALEIGPGVRKLEIRYTTPSLRIPERARFRYRLDGLEAGWSDPTDRRVAHYMNIPPGRYRFAVTATNDEGVASAAEASLSFRLLPHFYQTAWFMAVLGALGAAALFGAHRLRVRHLHAREKELARRVDEALSQVKMLRGMLPVCASCKKIRDDSGYWNQMETYLAEHSAVDFSHGICPDCIQKLYPEYAADTGTSG